jgi:hypothetical protein
VSKSGRNVALLFLSSQRNQGPVRLYGLDVLGRVKEPAVVCERAISSLLRQIVFHPVVRHSANHITRNVTGRRSSEFSRVPTLGFSSGVRRGDENRTDW